MDENNVPCFPKSNNYPSGRGNPSSSIYSRGSHGMVSHQGISPNVMSPSSHSQFNVGHGGNSRVMSSLESFDPHAEPEFLTDGKRLEVVLGDTVVLPCKLKNLGKIKLYQLHNILNSLERYVIIRLLMIYNHRNLYKIFPCISFNFQSKFI